MAELFGFSIQKSSQGKGGEKTFTTPTPDDGTIDVVGGGFFGQSLNTDGRERTEIQLIKRYRDISQQSECDAAIEDIVNEGIVANQTDVPVVINTSMNVMGEPIVNTPEQAYNMIKKTDMDYIAMGNNLVSKLDTEV